MSQTEGYKSLVHAVRMGVLARIGGQLSIVLAILCLPSALAAAWFEEWKYLWTLLPLMVVLAALGNLSRKLPDPHRLLTSEGYVLACAAFGITPLLMVLALAPSGLPLHVLFFETVSAVTTTGLSNVGPLEHLDRTLLFTRSWMQWYGGLGIVVLSVTMLMQRSEASSQLLELPEGKGFVTSALVYARRVLIVYLVLTVLAALVCWWALGRGFEGLLHGLSAISTGGFSSADDSLAHLPFPVQLAVMSGGVAGAISLAIYLRIWQGPRRQVAGNQELRTFLLLSVLLCIALSLMMLARGDTAEAGVAKGVILGLSALSTTGFSNADIGALDSAAKLVLVLAMFIGGCLGSTAGGLKIHRLRIIAQYLLVTLRRASAPAHAVIEPRSQGKVLEPERIQEAMLIGGLLVAVLALSWLPFLWYGYEPLDALFEVASAVGTVGLSTGIVSPDLPAALKAVLCFDMIAGRVEVIALVCLLYPGLWTGRRYSDL
ncbi:MAG: TrkH family potassium uptake protein [Lysobacterales bacterium]|jgi:trk system potassium uptake protein TrkH